MKILTDTPSLYAPHQNSEEGLIVVPACTVLSDTAYRDIEDITTDDFLGRIRDGEIATSSQPSIGDILEVFEKSEDDILVLPIGDGLSCALGHCFPVFAGFRGGKAVATMYGFIFGMVVVGRMTPLLFFIPLMAFLAIIFITRVVAVSSIGSALTVLIYSAFFEESPPLTISLAIFTLLMIIRHSSNIKRLLRGEENKVKWIK